MKSLIKGCIWREKRLGTAGLQFAKNRRSFQRRNISFACALYIVCISLNRDNEATIRMRCPTLEESFCPVSVSCAEKKLISIRVRQSNANIWTFLFSFVPGPSCRRYPWRRGSKRYVRVNDDRGTEGETRERACTRPDERPANICIARRVCGKPVCRRPDKRIRKRISLCRRVYTRWSGRNRLE